MPFTIFIGSIWGDLKNKNKIHSSNTQNFIIMAWFQAKKW